MRVLLALIAVLLFPLDAVAAQLLKNSCFGSGVDVKFLPITQVATDWVDDLYSGRNAVAAYTIVASGAEGCVTAQQINVTSIAAKTVRFRQEEIALSAGNTYQFVVWLKATSTNASVRIHLQNKVGPSNPDFSSAACDVGSEYKPCWLNLTVVKNVSVHAAIDIGSVGTVTIGKATLVETPKTMNRPSAAIDPRFFGLHVAGYEQNLLRNPNFGGPYDPVAAFGDGVLAGSVAHGWQDNSAWGKVNIVYAPDWTAPPPGRSVSQRVRVVDVQKNANGDESQMALVQQLTVAPNKTYEFSVLMRGTAENPVDISGLDVFDPEYAAYFQTTCTLSVAWKWCSVSDQIGKSGVVQLIISTKTKQTFWIGGATFVDKTTGKAVKAHIPWPATPAGKVGRGGTLRLWDSGTTWRDLQPRPGASGWDFTVLDDWVAAATAHDEDVVLTLGQTPVWASEACDYSKPGAAKCGPVIDLCKGYRPAHGAGASAAPRDDADWRTYVRTLAERYNGGAHGRIRYWEIWNEPADCTFYDGTPDRLARLTEITAEEVVKVDPTNVVISPAVSIFPPASDPGDFSASLKYLDDYLAALTNKNAIGVVAVHVYAAQPETAASILTAARSKAKAWRSDVQFWDTEGAAAALEPTDAGRAAIIARRHLVDLLYGAERFAWYSWGTEGIDCPDPASSFKLPCVGTVQATAALPPNAAGRALSVLENWLIGAKINAADIDAKGTWRIALTAANGAKRAIVWNPAGSALPGPISVTLPGAVKATKSIALSGVVTALPSVTSTVTATTSPTLYQ